MKTDGKPVKKVLTSSEIGDTGVQFFSGVITGEEYKRNLTGRRGLLIWDEMRGSDATVSAALRAVKLPIKSTKFFPCRHSRRYRRSD